MGDKAILAKARKELEDLYLGVPDESVDLSFKDFTSFQQNDVAETKTIGSMCPIQEEPPPKVHTVAAPVNSSPSLDFAKGLQGAAKNYEREIYRERIARNSFKRSNKSSAVISVENSNRAYVDDASGLSMVSAAGEAGRRKRPGIPHSNICALCSAYIYIFRNRCLVCGRVYCRKCVGIGMGDMPEGRKCVQCLGRRYSQRYIKRAGQTCCWRYPSRVKLQELIWAEKGPKRNGERRYRSGVSSASMWSAPTMPMGSPRALLGSPMSSPVPGSPVASHFSINHDSFIMNSVRPPSPHGFPL
ncbi:hypothetical protein Cni_G04577 [Canna indica]|uniref:Uncharacterized protein n=1 Tax=Canna indica TaxID=4628 RepID=A0AAQ3JX99_9LILI|nr:hypothetical protein Cni_G04577 [Canna indica]